MLVPSNLEALKKLRCVSVSLCVSVCVCVCMRDDFNATVGVFYPPDDLWHGVMGKHGIVCMHRVSVYMHTYELIDNILS